MRGEEKKDFYVETCYPSRSDGPRTRISDGEFEWVVDKEADAIPRARLVDLFNFYRETYG